jgi:hypothetical protein
MRIAVSVCRIQNNLLHSAPAVAVCFAFPLV